jgi:hypothetical protein
MPMWRTSTEVAVMLTANVPTRTRAMTAAFLSSGEEHVADTEGRDKNQHTCRDSQSVFGSSELHLVQGPQQVASGGEEE